MKSIKIISLMAAMTVSVMAFSQNQTITMKDGTVYEGFISHQNYIDGTGEISYSKVTKQIPTDQIHGKRTEKKELQSLSQDWQDWAVANHKVELSGKDKKYLSLTTMTVAGVTKEWYILVSGSKYVTAFTLTKGTDFCMMKDIVSISKPERSETLLTDMDDIIQTDGVSYSGVLLEQKPGVSYTIWSNEDKSVHSIDFADVRSVGKARFNPDYSIWSQTPVLERLTLKQGVTAEGLILETTFTPSFGFLFAEKSGDGMNTRQYPLNEVKSVERYINKDYAPVYDIVLGENESRVNRDSVLVEAEIEFIYTSDSSKIFFLNPDKPELIAEVSSPEVVIETSVAGVGEVFVAKAKDVKAVPMTVLRPETQATDKKSAKKRSKEPVKVVDIVTYTYASLIESELVADVSTSINGTTSISFTLPEPGSYFVYLHRLGKVWVVKWNQ